MAARVHGHLWAQEEKSAVRIAAKDLGGAAGQPPPGLLQRASPSRRSSRRLFSLEVSFLHCSLVSTREKDAMAGEREWEEPEAKEKERQRRARATAVQRELAKDKEIVPIASLSRVPAPSSHKRPVALSSKVGINDEDVPERVFILGWVDYRSNPLGVHANDSGSFVLSATKDSGIDASSSSTRDGTGRSTCASRICWPLTLKSSSLSITMHLFEHLGKYITEQLYGDYAYGFEDTERTKSMGDLGVSDDKHPNVVRLSHDVLAVQPLQPLETHPLVERPSHHPQEQVVQLEPVDTTARHGILAQPSLGRN
ncbi:hypothetical protein BKA70DRAFT_1222632 [Coprinopsis sp. MPI-PUGE-AT-0042]|nr:hypothetical protein BKA70DRAFT_1222632 [Coprinopsis sp. MPI-PUGE-AT-0042]